MILASFGFCDLKKYHDKKMFYIYSVYMNLYINVKL